jgi:hypothetical protein
VTSDLPEAVPPEPKGNGATKAKRWYPIIRDYGSLVLGVALGVIGVYNKDAALTTLGFSVAGFGAFGRWRTAGDE